MYVIIDKDIHSATITLSPHNKDMRSLPLHALYHYYYHSYHYQYQHQYTIMIKTYRQQKLNLPWSSASSV